MPRFLFVILALSFATSNLSCNSKSGKRVSVIDDIQRETLYILDSQYKVIGVKDGDTFVLLMDGKEQTVRFAHIDCPEKKQPFGNRAKQFVSERCFGRYVTLIHNNRYDRNKRLIGEVLLADGSNLNKELVKNGLAWHFKKYSDDGEYARLEAAARKRKTGIWSERAPVAPWDWRKGRRTR